MRKLIFILMVALPFIVKGQSPVSPVQVPQATMYNEPSTGTRWFYNGSTLQWYPIWHYTNGYGLNLTNQVFFVDTTKIATLNAISTHPISVSNGLSGNGTVGNPIKLGGTLSQTTSIANTGFDFLLGDASFTKGGFDLNNSGTGSIKIGFNSSRININPGILDITSVTGPNSSSLQVLPTSTELLSTSAFSSTSLTLTPSSISVNDAINNIGVTGGSLYPISSNNQYAQYGNVVPNARTLTINGTTFDLSANRTWIAGTVTSVGSGYGLLGGPITSIGTLTADTASSDGLVSKGRLNNTNFSDTSGILKPSLVTSLQEVSNIGNLKKFFTGNLATKKIAVFGNSTVAAANEFFTTLATYSAPGKVLNTLPVTPVNLDISTGWIINVGNIWNEGHNGLKLSEMLTNGNIDTLINRKYDMIIIRGPLINDIRIGTTNLDSARRLVNTMLNKVCTSLPNTVILLDIENSLLTTDPGSFGWIISIPTTATLVDGIAGGVTPGTHVITVSNMPTSFMTGQQVYINFGLGDQEIVTVTALTETTFTATFTASHSAGFACKATYASASQSYSVMLRNALMPFANSYPNLCFLDMQTLEYGTKAPSTSPLMLNALHPGPHGRIVEGEIVGDFLTQAQYRISQYAATNTVNTFNQTQYLKSTEALRVINGNGFIPFYNSSNTIRSGYLQIDSAATNLSADGRPINILQGKITTDSTDNYKSDLTAKYTARTKIDQGYANAHYAPISIVGSVTNVSSATSDIAVSSATTTPVLTLNNVNGITKSYYDPTSSIQTQLNTKNSGSGTNGYIAKYTGTNTHGNSILQENSGNIGLGVTPNGGGASTTTFEFINGAQIGARTSVPQFYFSSNVLGAPYSPTRSVSGYATQLFLDSFGGTIGFNRAATGSSGSAITWLNDLSFDNNGNATFGGAVAINHIIGSSGTPTIAAGPAAGTSPTISITGTDMGGQINILVGSSPSGNNLATITFNIPYTIAPRAILLSPASYANIGSPGNSVLVPGVGETGSPTINTFTLVAGSALSAGSTYRWYYQVIQ